MNKFQEYSFLFIAFILGWASLFGNALSFILIPLIAINIYKNTLAFSKNIKKEWFYTYLPLAFCIYLLLLFVVQYYILGYQAKPSFAIFEKMFLHFFTIPLYILSMKPYINKALLKKSLLLFSGGVFFFNAALFFIQTGWAVFSAPITTINEMYLTRFGLNKLDILGRFSLMLEPQSMAIALALLSSLFICIRRQSIISAIISLGLLLFLSFTLTKAAILGSIIGCIFLTNYAIRKTMLKNRLLLAASATVILGCFIYFTPSGITKRINDTKTEIQQVKNDNIVDGSISPRIALWKRALEHKSEYAIFGKGLYSDVALKQWYADLPDAVIHRANTHNSFLEYWIKGGILGLLLLISYFIFPIGRMFKLKQYSSFILGGLSIIFITNSTCVLFIHSNSLGIILFWLAAYYFYTSEFISLEHDKQHN